MLSFLEFINKDIESKKVILSSMPLRTKTNKIKYNETIEEYKNKYLDYKQNLKNYLLAKNRSFILKQKLNSSNVKEKLESLEHVKFLLNPMNTYFEKMGFDDLLFQIDNYHTFNFSSLENILNAFLDKFELIGVKLNSDDFKYTYYVNEYMKSFLSIREKKEKNYDKVVEVFEKIYWVNPELVEHITINLMKLIESNKNKFDNYIEKLQKQVCVDNKVKNYSDCLNKLSDLSTELNELNKETIYDIVDGAIDGSIEISNYFKDNKVRNTTYQSLLVNMDDVNVPERIDKICDSFEMLLVNMEEYSNYAKFELLINDFKKTYVSFIGKTYKAGENFKKVQDDIKKKEKDLDKINKKIFSNKSGLFGNLSEKESKTLKIQSVSLAKELRNLYKKLDEEYFKDKVMKILSNTLTVSDLLNLYYSFDYFKKIAINKVFNISSYDEILELSDSFDLFAMNPTNIIVYGLLLFNENNIAKTISNKYRLNNINVREEDLLPDNLDILKNEILLILRTQKIDNSTITDIDKIWFMTRVENIIKSENK